MLFITSILPILSRVHGNDYVYQHKNLKNGKETHTNKHLLKSKTKIVSLVPVD